MGLDIMNRISWLRNIKQALSGLYQAERDLWSHPEDTLRYSKKEIREHVLEACHGKREQVDLLRIQWGGTEYGMSSQDVNCTT